MSIPCWLFFGISSLRALGQRKKPESFEDVLLFPLWMLSRIFQDCYLPLILWEDWLSLLICELRLTDAWKISLCHYYKRTSIPFCINFFHLLCFPHLVFGFIFIFFFYKRIVDLLLLLTFPVFVSICFIYFHLFLTTNPIHFNSCFDTKILLVSQGSCRASIIVILSFLSLISFWWNWAD